MWLLSSSKNIVPIKSYATFKSSKFATLPQDLPTLYISVFDITRGSSFEGLKCSFLVNFLDFSFISCTIDSFEHLNASDLLNFDSSNRFCPSRVKVGAVVSVKWQHTYIRALASARGNVARRPKNIGGSHSRAREWAKYAKGPRTSKAQFSFRRSCQCYYLVRPKMIFICYLLMKAKILWKNQGLHDNLWTILR